MTEHKELAIRARKLGNQPNPGENLAEWIDFASLYLVQSADAIEEHAAEIARLREALEEIADFGAEWQPGAEECLARTGSYHLFDEPSSVKIARTALTHPPETGS
jgi:hypothetical protein